MCQGSTNILKERHNEEFFYSVKMNNTAHSIEKSINKNRKARNRANVESVVFNSVAIKINGRNVDYLLNNTYYLLLLYLLLENKCYFSPYTMPQN